MFAAWYVADVCRKQHVTAGEAAIRVGVGSHIRFRGDVLKIEEVDALKVTAAVVGQGITRSIHLPALFSEAQPCSRAGEVLQLEYDLQWEMASGSDKDEATHLARELFWVITGHKFDPDNPTNLPPLPGLTSRAKELALRLDVTPRTVERYVRAFRASGGAVGLTRPHANRRRRSAIDQRWEQKLSEVVSRIKDKSKWDVKPVLEDVAAELDAQYGRDVVRIPGKTTAYQYIQRNYKGTNAFTGSTKGRRSIADRPAGNLGRLVATRAGEFIIMDTHSLDCFAMEALTGRWVSTQLTVAQDLYTRSIVGLCLTPVSTKAVDVATVLFETCHPKRVAHRAHPDALWNYHGVPENIVFDEETPHWGMPLVAPENILVDNGKAFISRHVMEVCHRKGINVMPSQPYKPTDKPTVERFFNTLRRDLIVRLPGYKGPDVYSRGKSPEEEAFYYVHELEDIIRHWITRRYHSKDHGGLVEPVWDADELCPDDMYELSVATHGLPRMAHDPYAFVEFLPIAWRTKFHYGFEVNTRKYKGEVLSTFDGDYSPYGGVHAGRWPIRYNPDDIRTVFIQDPRNDRCHELEWEDADRFDLPLSEDVYRILRKWSQRTKKPIPTSRQIVSDWISAAALDRKGRNALLRSAHFAQKRNQLIDPDLRAPQTVTDEELIEESAWDLLDEDREPADDKAVGNTDLSESGRESAENPGEGGSERPESEIEPTTDNTYDYVPRGLVVR